MVQGVWGSLLIDHVDLAVEGDLVLARHPEQELLETSPLDVLTHHVHVAEHGVDLVEGTTLVCRAVRDYVQDERAH